jgi:coenzyme F420 hydrogenase subunit beta
MGCGACIGACENGNIRLIDIPDQGLRPVVDPAKCLRCGKCIEVCPGIEVSHQPFNNETITELRSGWGPVLEVWEGYAADPEIRFKGSSGGVTTALALFCLEKGYTERVLHIAVNPRIPWQNAPVLSRSRADLLKTTGSRYSPAAPCERLDWIAESSSPCVFIGKPCDVAALHKSQAFRPSLKRNLALTISCFCAGTPTTNGTLHLLKALNVEPEKLAELRYRGCGWPGRTSARLKGESNKIRQMSYEESWGGILSNYGQLRCRLCPDTTGEFADIACGDPWHKNIEPEDPGQSLVLVRTERARELFHQAFEEGYIAVKRAEPWALPKSQRPLLNRRRYLFGRLLTMRLTGIPIPRYKGFSLFRNWLTLPTIEKLRSLAGTLKRITSRGWTRPLKQDLPETASNNSVITIKTP